MSDFKDAESIYEMYNASQSATMQELSQTIVMLRTKVTYLEKQVKNYEEMTANSVPPHAKFKLDKLQKENKDLKSALKDAQNTPVSSYFEKEFRKVLKQKEQLEEDLEYYKKKVPVQIVINREKKTNPTRGGGQLR